MGIRDKAILLLLARLGLRAGDILGMRLDDIAWDEGTLRVRGKGRREVRLPLPQDAGDALLDYLERARPLVDDDRMFLRSSAPYRPFAGPCAISDVVRLGAEARRDHRPAISRRQPAPAFGGNGDAARRCHAGRHRSRAPASIGRYDRSLRQGRCRHAAADRATLAGRRVMLSQDLTRYVDLHRSLGFKFRTQHSLLRNFVAFAEAQGDEFVRVDRVLDWAARAPSPPQRRNRLLTVRRFALAMQAEDSRHEVPAADALGHGTFDRRTAPYLSAG